MARLYHTFGDYRGKLDVLRVECINCQCKNEERFSGSVFGCAACHDQHRSEPPRARNIPPPGAERRA